uniref:Uncharacterized protein n=1 Tax=Oryza glumipatula TaxID=40148 RepID=A0A0E0BF65_9ORYZ
MEKKPSMSLTYSRRRLSVHGPGSMLTSCLTVRLKVVKGRRLPKQCHLVPGSPSAKSSEAAGGWWNGGVLGQLSGWWFVEVGRRRGVGAVWWMPRTAICLCGGSELVDGDLQSRLQGPSPVVHRVGNDYVFGRRNLFGALSRMGEGGILDVVTTMVASFSEPRLCGIVVGLAAFGHA